MAFKKLKMVLLCKCQLQMSLYYVVSCPTRWHSLWATVGINTNLESPSRAGSGRNSSGSRKDLSVPASERQRPVLLWLLRESLHPGPDRERIGSGTDRGWGSGVRASAHPHSGG